MISYRRRYTVLLSLSLLAHLALLYFLLDELKYEQPIVKPKNVVISLLQPSLPSTEPDEPPTEPEQKQEQKEEVSEKRDEPRKEESKKEQPEESEEPDAPEEEHHAPMDNADAFASNNQEDPSINKIDPGGGNESENTKKPDQQTDEDTDANEAPKSPELAERPEALAKLVEQETDEGQADQKKERDVIDTLDIARALWESRARDITQEQLDAMKDKSGSPEQDLVDLITGKANFTQEQEDFEMMLPEDIGDGLGNATLLTDSELSEAVVEQPFSEQKAKELELANLYLRRMNEQVRSFWVNPYEGNRLYKGIIKVELDVTGHLENAYVYRSSGNHLLDISVLDAIRAVPRYKVPDNDVIVNRYYRNLSFYYSSIEEETELMPFEKERKNEQESQ